MGHLFKPKTCRTAVLGVFILQNFPTPRVHLGRPVEPNPRGPQSLHPPDPPRTCSSLKDFSAQEPAFQWPAATLGDPFKQPQKSAGTRRNLSAVSVFRGLTGIERFCLRDLSWLQQVVLLERDKSIDGGNWFLTCQISYDPYRGYSWTRLDFAWGAYKKGVWPQDQIEQGLQMFKATSKTNNRTKSLVRTECCKKGYETLFPFLPPSLPPFLPPSLPSFPVKLKRSLIVIGENGIVPVVSNRKDSFIPSQAFPTRLLMTLTSRLSQMRYLGVLLWHLSKREEHPGMKPTTLHVFLSSRKKWGVHLGSCKSLDIANP